MKKLLNNILQNNVPRPVPFLSRDFFYRVNRFLSRVSFRKSQHDACHGHSRQSVRIIEIRHDLDG
jgi:hypothetical protein